jgi:hypothetical protein
VKTRTRLLRPTTLSNWSATQQAICVAWGIVGIIDAWIFFNGTGQTLDPISLEHIWMVYLGNLNATWFGAMLVDSLFSYFVKNNTTRIGITIAIATLAYQLLGEPFLFPNIVGPALGIVLYALHRGSGPED